MALTCTCPKIHTHGGLVRSAMDIECPVHGDPHFRKPAPEEIAKAEAEIVQTPETAAQIAQRAAADQDGDRHEV